MTIDAVSGRLVLVGNEFVPATVLIRNGRITGVAGYDDHVEGTVLTVPGSAYVLPGVVDTHVHVNEPGRTEWEGFETATLAAALGGVTTLADMPLNSIPPTTTVAALDAKRKAADGELVVDVAFWAGAVPGNVADLEQLRDAGVVGFKCFLAPSGVEEFPPLNPAEFDAALTEVARLGGLLAVHAEDAAVLADAPAAPSRAYADFVLSRPETVETTAIKRVIDGVRATGCRVHILHLSSAHALDLIAAARADGLPITVETCPHYLIFAAEQIPEAAPQFKCCPPIRDRGNREELWRALEAGVIDAVVSDHSPAAAAEKLRGDGDLQQAWGGVSGLQVGFVAIVDAARRRGIGLEQVSRWMSHNAAVLAGLGDKGRIETDADADILVYDTNADFRVRAQDLAHRIPISAYDGMRLQGRISQTVVRGRVIDFGHPDRAWGRILERAA